MAKSIAFASGKGGVGKSSIALNLGIVLAESGKRVIVVDADLPMANIGLMLGVERIPITLNNILIGENAVLDALYEGPKGLKYVPAELSVDRVDRVDYNRLRNAIKTLEEHADYVLVDCPPGWAQDAKAAMSSAQYGVIVLTPEPSSLADALKVRSFFDRSEVELLGVAMNMVLNDPSEIKKQEIESILGSKVIAVLPEDIEVRRASASQTPVAVKSPRSAFCRSLKELAAAITGEKLVVPETKVKKGFLRNILDFFAGLFKKK